MIDACNASIAPPRYPVPACAPLVARACALVLAALTSPLPARAGAQLLARCRHRQRKRLRRAIAERTAAAAVDSLGSPEHEHRRAGELARGARRAHRWRRVRSRPLLLARLPPPSSRLRRRRASARRVPMSTETSNALLGDANLSYTLGAGGVWLSGGQRREREHVAPQRACRRSARDRGGASAAR